MRIKQLFWLSTQLGLTFLVVLFVFQRAGDLKVQLEGVFNISHLPTLFISGLVFLVFYIILSFHWLEICRMVSKESTSKNQWLSFFASQPYKYLPTSLFTFSFRAKFAKDLGLSVKDSSAAQLIENLNLIASALVIVITILAFRLSAMVGLVVAVLVVLVFVALQLKQTVFIPKTRYSIETKKLTRTFVIALTAWLIAGLSLAVIGITFGSSLSLSTFIAANSIAFAGGIMAVFAPGGIGVRELIFSYFAVSIDIILIWRLLTLVLDIVVGIIGMGIVRKLKETHPS